MTFRCAAASLERAEDALGSASTVRAFLLVENAGPWGVDAVRDARLPGEVSTGLRSRAARSGVRVLLVRRHRGVRTGPGLRVFAAYADPASPWLETTTVAAPEELLDLDLEALGRGASPGLTPAERPVFCVCTHGRHDACCAERGRPTAQALARSHPEETWEVSHIGGDRYAANVLVLPDGLYYGRVSPGDAAGLATRHLAGHLELGLLRGRSGFAPAVQVAEVAVRRHAGVTRTDAVRLMSVAHSRPELPAGAADTTVRLDVAGRAYDVLVRRTPTGDEHLLTCRATRPNPTADYAVLAVNPL